MIATLAKLSRNAKRMLMVGSDIILLPLALWVAFSLRLGEIFIPGVLQIWIFILAPVVGIPVFIKMGLYRAIIHYMEFRAFGTVFKAVSLTILLWSIILLLAAPYSVPRSSIVIFWLLALLAVAGSRLTIRWLLGGEERKQPGIQCPRIAIYGAGDAGIQLALALKHGKEFIPVAFIDDNIELHGHEIADLHVYSSESIEDVLKKESISQILIAIPSSSNSVRRSIIHMLEPYPVDVRILPGLSQLAKGTINIEQIRNVGIEDLLGRDSVSPMPELFEACISGKVVMVTGAGGSIGSELCRQIIQHQPKRIVLFERNEFALYKIEQELNQSIKERDNDLEIIPILGSVHHRHRVEKVCSMFAVQTIYHAAAYKHVPLVEFNPFEAIHNNCFGTLHIAEAAIAAGVETFVLISTDKAVRPTNVMGASKRLAELVLQALSVKIRDDGVGPRFCMVRFGNVLGSSGSVVPLFMEQIRQDGPVTVTHADITRYFMTIPEAAQLVLQAGAMGEGGDVFVLDMGEPVRIIDLARQMIHLSGLSVKDDGNQDGDIEIKTTGLRPGEKLYEELLIGDDVEGTSHPLIMRANEEMINWIDLHLILNQMMEASQKFDVKQLRELLQDAVKGYQPQSELQDLTWAHKNEESTDLAKITKLPLSSP